MYLSFILIGLSIGLIPLLVLIFFKIEKTVFQRLLPIYLLVFVSSFYELVFSYALTVDVTNWFIIYSILSFWCYTYYFYVLLNKRFKPLFILFTVVFVLNRLALHFPISPLFDLNQLFKDGISSSIDTLVFLVCSIVWFRQLFLEMNEDSLFKQPDFYIVSGLNIYYCGTVFLFLIAHKIHELNPKALSNIWTMNIVMNIVFRILMIVALFVQRKKQLAPQQECGVD